MKVLISIFIFLFSIAWTHEAVAEESIATDSNITFTFSEAVRNLDNVTLTNSNVGSLITLKDSGETGSNISFTATINTAKTMITINPTSNFYSQQVVYAAIGATVEDYSDNVIPATSKTFTAEYLKTELLNPLNEKDIVGLIEKPSVENAPSNLAVVGRYIIEPTIFDVLENQHKGSNNEIQLTDAIANRIGKSICTGYKFSGERFDCGSKLGFIQANIKYSIERNEFNKELKQWLKDEILKSES
jgi:hypothetical protein